MAKHVFQLGLKLGGANEVGRFEGRELPVDPRTPWRFAFERLSFRGAAISGGLAARRSPRLRWRGFRRVAALRFFLYHAVSSSSTTQRGGSGHTFSASPCAGDLCLR